MRSAFFVLTIVLFCSRHGVAQQRFWSTQSQECLICEVAAYDIHYEDDGDGEAFACITNAPYENGGSGVGYFHLPLPDDFVEAHRSAIMAGNLQICIEGGVASRHNYTVSYPDGAKISLVPTLSVRGFTPSRLNGDFSLLAVRVSSRAGEDPGLSLAEIEGAVFGTGLNASDPNVTSQYEECSAGNLRFHAATGSNINNGVIDIVVDGPFQGGDMVGSLQSAITAAIESAVGGSVDQFSKMMFCVPSGSTIPGAEAMDASGWSAFGRINGDITIFQNQNCGRISATMHELGHNLGFYHSSKGNEEYGDHTCIMSTGYKAFRWPKRCFNGHKNWIAGWYASRQVSVDPSSNGADTGRLVGFVEWNYAGLQSSDVVLINLQDVYIQFNRRVGPNVESQDAYDLVTVTQGTSTNSYNLAMLNATQSFTYNNGTSANVVIEVCDIVFGTALDYARVSIYVEGSQSSTCNSATASPATTQTTTLVPSVAPTPKATIAVTTVAPNTVSPTTISPDTFAPTKPPAGSPSLSPSTSPTEPDTVAPSLSPSTSPTVAPSNASLPTVTTMAPSTGGGGSTLFTPPTSLMGSPKPSTSSPSTATSVLPTKPPTNSSTFSPSIWASVNPTTPQAVLPSMSPTDSSTLSPSIGASVNPTTPQSVNTTRPPAATSIPSNPGTTTSKPTLIVTIPPQPDTTNAPSQPTTSTAPPTPEVTEDIRNNLNSTSPPPTVIRNASMAPIRPSTVQRRPTKANVTRSNSTTAPSSNGSKPTVPPYIFGNPQQEQNQQQAAFTSSARPVHTFIIGKCMTCLLLAGLTGWFGFVQL